NIVAGVPDEQIVVVGRASAATFDHDLLDASTPPSCAFRWGGTTIAPGSPPAAGTCGTLAAYRAATGEEAHGLQGDAAVVSPTDDHILGTSAARDAGGCVPALTTVDHDGGARPFGPACDIGAHEFGSTPPGLATVDRCLRGAALVLRDAPGRPARRRFLLRS